MLQAFAKNPDASDNGTVGQGVQVEDQVAPTIVIPETPLADPCLISNVFWIWDFVSGSCQPYFLWK